MCFVCLSREISNQKEEEKEKEKEKEKRKYMIIIYVEYINYINSAFHKW